MSCSPDTLKDYLLGELNAAEAARLKGHLTSCANCQEEWDRLQLTHTALLAVADEEPLRRTAFVSDQVFAPRWYQKLWHSGPQLGFASAGLLAVAIVAHGFLMRPPAPAAVSSVSPSSAVVQAQVEQEVEKRLKPLIAQAVAESEARVTKRNLELVNASLKDAEHRLTLSQKADMRARTSCTAGTTSSPSTRIDWPFGARSATCSTARRSVRLIFSPENMASMRWRSPHSSARLTSRRIVSSVTRFFE